MRTDRMRWRSATIGLAIVLVIGLGCESNGVGGSGDDGSETTAVTGAGSSDSGDSGETAGDPTDGPDPVPDMLPEPDPFAELETDAAIDDLQVIVDLAFALFLAENPPGEGEPADWPLHRCPTAWGQSASSSGVTPDAALDCNEGPDGRCVPVDENGGGPGQYTLDLWLQNFVWAGLGFAKLEPHAFHYEFQAVNATDGYGACTFTARAHADLDDDSVFSTYERRGSADENGIVEDPMLYVFLAGE